MNWRLRSPPFHRMERYDLLRLMVIKQSKVRFLQAGDRFAGRIGHNASGATMMTKYRTNKEPDGIGILGS